MGRSWGQGRGCCCTSLEGCPIHPHVRLLDLNVADYGHVRKTMTDIEYGLHSGFYSKVGYGCVPRPALAVPAYDWSVGISREPSREGKDLWCPLDLTFW